MTTPAFEVILGPVMEGLKGLPDRSVQCVVTSPPYWGLRSYLPADHPAKAEEIGQEPTPDAYVARLVEVFGEVRRVLRVDGTLWLNLGDTYSSGGRSRYAPDSKGGAAGRAREKDGRPPTPDGLKPKDLVGIPWTVAFALRAAGWYLRIDNVWHKPNPMSESVTDRPARCHEYLFLLSKSADYFYDVDATREPFESAPQRRPNGRKPAERPGVPPQTFSTSARDEPAVDGHPLGRNKRSVWTIATVTNKATSSHFAAFPPELVRPCIRAGTSERGACPACGAGWVRVVRKERKPTRPGRSSKVYVDPEGSPYEQHSGSIVGNRDPLRHVTETYMLGWRPACTCYADAYREWIIADGGDPADRATRDAYFDRPAPDDWASVPAIVMDPFSGTGTTGAVALEEGRSYVGFELHPDHHAASLDRLALARDGRALPLFDVPAPAALPPRRGRKAPAPGQEALAFGE